MIYKDEIDAKAGELGIVPANVERDYVFGWLLAGIFQPHNGLSQQLILKGGNAFRKAYFPAARFSKDLDFSTQRELNLAAFEDDIDHACQFVSEKTGIEFDLDRQNIKLKRGADEDNRAYEARVYFKGFYGEEHCTISAKMDVKEFDKIFLPTQLRPIIHDYSDSADCIGNICSMKLEELVANKLKALLQRDHSPDLFDFVYAVFIQNALNIDRLELIRTFIRKTIYERNPFAVFDLLVKRPLAAIKDAWTKYLVVPKRSILSFDEAEAQFRNGLDTLFTLLGVDARSAPRFATAAALDYFSADRRSLIPLSGSLRLSAAGMGCADLRHALCGHAQL